MLRWSSSRLMDRLVLEFVRERETKGTWRYQEVESANGEPAVGSLYVQKAQLGDPAPMRLRVIIDTGSFADADDV